MSKVEFHLLDFEELKAKRSESPLRPGIYFLWAGDEIVYIGQSANMHSRVGQHLSGGTSTNRHLRKINLTAVTFVELPLESLDVWEALYIAEYKPKCNGIRRNECPV